MLDNILAIPVNHSQSVYYQKNSEKLNATIGQAIAKMRDCKKIKPIEEDNFDIIRSDNLTQIMFENIKYVTIAA